VGTQHSGKCVIIDLGLHILITQPGSHKSRGSWQSRLLIQFCTFLFVHFCGTSWNIGRSFFILLSKEVSIAF